MTITQDWENAGQQEINEADVNEPQPIPVIIHRSEGERVSPEFANCMTWPINTFANTQIRPQAICPHRYHRYKAKMVCTPGAGSTGVVLNTRQDSLMQPNPQGAVYTFPNQTPTNINQIPLGATGVATFNNNAFGVNQTISGGTVTAIAINGTTTGLTSGTFFVPAGGTVTVTYSVAPTTFTTSAIPATNSVFPLPEYDAERALYAIALGGPVTITVIDEAYGIVQ